MEVSVKISEIYSSCSQCSAETSVFERRVFRWSFCRWSCWRAPGSAPPSSVASWSEFVRFSTWSSSPFDPPQQVLSASSCRCKADSLLTFFVSNLGSSLPHLAAWRCLQRFCLASSWSREAYGHDFLSSLCDIRSRHRRHFSLKAWSQLISCFSSLCSRYILKARCSTRQFVTRHSAMTPCVFSSMEESAPHFPVVLQCSYIDWQFEVVCLWNALTRARRLIWLAAAVQQFRCHWTS